MSNARSHRVRGQRRRFRRTQQSLRDRILGLSESGRSIQGGRSVQQRIEDAERRLRELQANQPPPPAKPAAVASKGRSMPAVIAKGVHLFTHDAPEKLPAKALIRRMKESKGS